MKHLKPEQLVDHYYGEAGRGVADHLADCYECRTEFASIQRTLSAIQPPEAPARGPNYGAEVWDRVRGHLAVPEPKRQWWLRPQRWAIVGAMAALVLIAFLAGRHTAPPPSPAAAHLPPQVVKERVLMVALGEHLERSQMVLLEVTHADDASDVNLVREQADDLLESNRLYRQAAQSMGDSKTADVLDQLERALVEISHSSPDESKSQIDRLRRQIESQGLLFKVRVIHKNVENEIQSVPKALAPRISKNPSQPRASGGTRSMA